MLYNILCTSLTKNSSDTRMIFNHFIILTMTHISYIHMLLATLTQGPTQAWRAATAWQLALATNIGQWAQFLPVRKYTSMIVWKYDSMGKMGESERKL